MQRKERTLRCETQALLAEPCLTDPGLTREEEDMTSARRGSLDDFTYGRDLAVATDEIGQGL